MTSIAFSYIDTNSTLATACASLLPGRALAIDTEFQRETTYYPLPALLQISDGTSTYLVDPLAIDDFSPLASLFVDTNVVKIMHSCSEDLEVFARLDLPLPQPLFDTQVAAAHCGFGYSSSYSHLVELVTGQVLEKSQTRSDWTRRPLSENQCRYAAEDVIWLPAIYDLLKQELGKLKRDAWCAQDCEQLLQNAMRNVPVDEAWLRFRGAWRLDGTQQNRLRSLAAWRESEARRRDIPRGRVIPDSALMEIAQSGAGSPGQLTKVKGMGAYSVRKYGEVIVELVDSADRQQPGFEASLPDKGSRAYRDLIKKMQQIVKSHAETMAMPVELLGRKRDLEEYLADAQNSLIKSSWRGELIGVQLDDAIDKSSYHPYPE